MPIEASKIPTELLEKVFIEMKDSLVHLNHASWKVISINPKKKTISIELVSVDEPVKEK